MGGMEAGGVMAPQVGVAGHAQRQAVLMMELALESRAWVADGAMAQMEELEVVWEACLEAELADCEVGRRAAITGVGTEGKMVNLRVAPAVEHLEGVMRVGAGGSLVKLQVEWAAPERSVETQFQAAKEAHPEAGAEAS